jgi:hypothetical protein
LLTSISEGQERGYRQQKRRDKPIWWLRITNEGQLRRHPYKDPIFGHTEMWGETCELNL